MDFTSPASGRQIGPTAGEDSPLERSTSFSSSRIAISWLSKSSLLKWHFGGANQSDVIWWWIWAISTSSFYTSINKLVLAQKWQFKWSTVVTPNIKDWKNGWLNQGDGYYPVDDKIKCRSSPFLTLIICPFFGFQGFVSGGIAQIPPKTAVILDPSVSSAVTQWYAVNTCCKQRTEMICLSPSWKWGYPHK